MNSFTAVFLACRKASSIHSISQKHYYHLSTFSPLSTSYASGSTYTEYVTNVSIFNIKDHNRRPNSGKEEGRIIGKHINQPVNFVKSGHYSWYDSYALC